MHAPLILAADLLGIPLQGLALHDALVSNSLSPSLIRFQVWAPHTLHKLGIKTFSPEAFATLSVIATTIALKEGQTDLWFDTPNSNLHDRKPIHLITTDPGRSLLFSHLTKLHSQHSNPV